MEDLSNNSAVITQVEFILSKALRYDSALGYRVDLITKHEVIKNLPDHPAGVIIYKDAVRGYTGSFYHDYDSSKDQHDFSGSARASFYKRASEGIVQSGHNALFFIRNIGVKYQDGGYVLMPHSNTLVSLAIS